MKQRSIHQLAALVACASLGADAAIGSERTTLVALREGSEVSCEPTLPYFCENMHVSCAGHTRVPAFPFKLHLAPGTSSAALRAEDEEGLAKYADGTLVWAEDGSSALYSPRSANGYIKVMADGRYAFRHYIGGRGVMSLGLCQ